MVDVDSTLSAIEGIDWLAALRSDSLRERVAATTDRAMRGEITVGAVYAERLEAVSPTRDEVAGLAQAYLERIEDGARQSLAMLTNLGVRVILISGGIREAILPLARSIGLAEADVHAVPIRFTEAGAYAGFEAESPLTQNGGKAAVVRGLRLERPILAVGDGITDLELKTLEPAAVDAFAAYTGVADRPAVTRHADYVIRGFDELPGIVTESDALDARSRQP